MCIFAPAQVLGSLLNQLSNGRLGLAAPAGSLWKGNASLLLKGIHAQESAVDLGKISWDTQPLQLLTGKLIVSLTWNNGAPFWITLDSSRLHIEHAAFSIPAEFMPFLVPALKVAQLGGLLAVRCDNFTLTRSEVLGQLEIDWNQASSPLSTVMPLGSYHAQLKGHGNAMDIRLETLGDGPLLLQGNGRLAVGDGLRFEGTAEAYPSAKVQLQELLRVMGNETTAGSGRYQLRF
jgi:general secretion pathway protein N